MMRRDNCLRRPAQVDLTHSACRTALCAHRTAGVDVNRTLQIAAVNVVGGEGFGRRPHAGGGCGRRGRVVDDRSPPQSYHFIASAEWGSPPEAALPAEGKVFCVWLVRAVHRQQRAAPSGASRARQK
jgi:hypothetical protein